MVHHLHSSSSLSQHPICQPVRQQITRQALLVGSRPQGHTTLGHTKDKGVYAIYICTMPTHFALWCNTASWVSPSWVHLGLGRTECKLGRSPASLLTSSEAVHTIKLLKHLCAIDFYRRGNESTKYQFESTYIDKNYLTEHLKSMVYDTCYSLIINHQLH